MGRTIFNFQRNGWKAVLLSSTTCILLWVLLIIPATFGGQNEVSKEERARRHVDRGRDLRNMGDLTGSLMDLNEALRLDPYSVDAYVERGLTRGMKKDYDGSFFDFDRALEIEPDNTFARYFRAQVHIMQNDLEGAYRDLEEVIKRNPEHQNAYLRRGMLRLLEEDYEAAKADFTEILKLDPNHYLALTLRGRSKARMGDRAGALADFDGALDLNGRLYQTLYYRGNLQLARGEINRALGDYDASIEINRRFPEVLERRGLVYYSLGRYADALGDLKKFVRLVETRERVDYPELWIFLTRLNMGEEAEARQHLKNHVEERLRSESEGGEPLDPWYLNITRFLLGEIRPTEFLESAIHEEEKRTLEMRCEAWYYLAQVRLRGNDSTEALRLLRKCIETELDMFYEYTSARVQILKLTGRAGRASRSSRRGG
jgi:tetratricopeptide (TPR) repeat protein